MFTLLVIVSVVCFVCLLLVASIQPTRPEFTESELSRRAVKSPAYAAQLRALKLYSSVETLLHIIAAILLVLTVLMFIYTFGWVIGLLMAIVVAATYSTLARVRLVHRPSQALYDRYEPKVLRFVERIQPTFRALGGGSGALNPDIKAASIEELYEIIDNSADVLSAQQRQLVLASFQFDDKTVRSIMTPRPVMYTIRKDEFLGPLVLDELHASGHSRLPVIGEDVDHIVGILHLRDLLSLDVKKSTTAEKAMEPKVFYINENDSLSHALAAFLKVRHHLFIVINENRETVGLLTLEDVIEALIGRRIVDENDVHDDLRAVAKSQGKTNNMPQNKTDV